MTSRRRTCLVLGLLTAASACSDSKLDPGSGTPTDPNGPQTVLPQPDGVPGAPLGCKYMDVVFSLDNSGSMQEEKAAMANDVFPAFAEALKQVGNGDIEWRAAVLDACPIPPEFHTRGLGGECAFFGGLPWMDDDSPSLTGEFTCVANIDPADNACTGENDDEQPASSIAAALEGNANPGFLRSNALLVAIAITDEDEQPTPDASAQEVYDRLVALKGGEVERMTFLGIGGASDCTGVYGTADPAIKLRATSDLFAAHGRGMFVDLCAGRLEDGLRAIITQIDQACDEYCPDPDGCDPYIPPPPSNEDCIENIDCPSGEYCEAGTCYPIVD